MRIISVGEILWDVFDDHEHLGGAPLNLAFHLSRLGHRVAMVSALGNDARGVAALDRAAKAGIGAESILRTPHVPTGTARVTLGASGQPTYRLVEPAAYDSTILSRAEVDVVARWQPGWICYGTLVHVHPRVLDSTERLFAACPSACRFYDVNLRPGRYNAGLVQRLAALAQILKLSEEEAPEVARLLNLEHAGPEAFLRSLTARFGCECVCLTRGKAGCAVLWGGEYAEYVGHPVEVADAVGAGDAFAAAFLHGWAAGWSSSRTASFANRVGALVASRSGATPEWLPAELE